MPIPVTCQCGQSFAAGDHLAGRTVQCPKCKSPLAIPAAQAMAAAPSPVAAPMPSAGGANIFDNAGIKARAQGVPTCPSCSAELAPNAVLCVKCGYHLQKGQRIGSQPMVGAGGGHDGHGSVAAAALARAAQTIDEDKENAKKEYSEGMPWWAIAGIFLFALAFLGGMLLLPGDEAFLAGGYTIAVVCWLVALYHSIRILMIAFNDNVGHGLACMFVPCYMFIYTVMHWDECGGHFLWQFIMGFISNIGFGMVGLAPYMKPSKEGETTQVPSNPPVVCMIDATEMLPRPTLKKPLPV